MQRNTVYGTALLVLTAFLLPSVAASEDVHLKKDVTILQPSTETTINIKQPFTVSTLNAEPGHTVIDGSKFTASGSTSDKITVNLTQYNKTASLNRYAINFTANTAAGNSVEFAFTFPKNQPYTTYRDGQFYDHGSSGSNGEYAFTADNWSSHEFSVQHAEYPDEGCDNCQSNPSSDSDPDENNSQDQVNESQDRWNVVPARGDRTDLNIHKKWSYPGKSLSIPFIVKNTGSTKAVIDVTCRSTTGACQWLAPDTTEVTVPPGKTKEVKVAGRIPKNISSGAHGFGVQFTDTKNNVEEAEVTVTVPLPVRIVFDGGAGIAATLEKLTEWKKFSVENLLGNGAKPVSVPFFILPVIPAILVFTVERAVSDTGGKVFALHVVFAAAVFFVVTALIPV